VTFLLLFLGGKRLTALSTSIATVFLLPMAAISYFTQVFRINDFNKTFRFIMVDKE
jgi:hypothetical protein